MRKPEKNNGHDAIAMMLFGGVILTGCMALLIGNQAPHYNIGELLAYTGLFGVAPVGYGMFRLWHTNKQNRLKEAEYQEYQIIRLAVDKKGQLTAVDVAMYFETSHEKAKALLEHLQLKDVFRPKVLEEGTVVFLLNDFLLES